MRFSAEGKIRWESVQLVEDKPLEPRVISVATVKARPRVSSSPDKNLAFWADLIDLAVASRPDLICLLEAMNTASITELSIHELAEPIRGATCKMLAEKARTYSTYVCGCFYERNGNLVFNTAVLMNRKGDVVGKYRKTHPYWPEESQGVSPGDEYPIFRTEIGNIAIIICYDSWFAETPRILSLKGADIILFPNAGYERKLLPARAIDNNVYLVVASLNSNAIIMNTLGEPLAESAAEGVISAKINLEEKPSPYPNAGGTLNSSPGGRKGTRNSRSLKLHKEILEELARWESRRH